MNKTMTPDERTAQTRKREDESFSRWMSLPETKLMLSLVPASENQDVLPTLMRSAFTAGSGFGQGDVACNMVEMMFAKREERP